MVDFRVEKKKEEEEEKLEDGKQKIQIHTYTRRAENIISLCHQSARKTDSFRNLYYEKVMQFHLQLIKRLLFFFFCIHSNENMASR